MVQAIGPGGPVDWMLETFGWVGGTLQGVLVVIGVIVLTVRLARLIAAGDFAAIAEDSALLIYLVGLAVALVLLVLQEARKRGEVTDPAAGRTSFE